MRYDKMMQLKMPCSIVKCLNQEGPSYDNRIGYRISVSPSVHAMSCWQHLPSLEMGWANVDHTGTWWVPWQWSSNVVFLCHLWEWWIDHNGWSWRELDMPFCLLLRIICSQFVWLFELKFVCFSAWVLNISLFEPDKVPFFDLFDILGVILMEL